MAELTRDLFEGRLVRLAAMQPADFEAVARWSEGSEYLRMVDTDSARPRTAEELAERQKEFAGPNSVEFGIRALEDDRIVGFVAIHSIEWNNGVGELAIGIGEPAEWGKGYGSDALALMLRYGFHELNLHRIGLSVISYNERAIRAYLRAGFVQEGVLREFGQRDGRRYDLVWMGILRPEWKALSSEEK